MAKLRKDYPMKILLAVLVGLTGCSGLRLRKTDSPGKKTAKVLARIPLAVVTFGISEMDISLGANPAQDRADDLLVELKNSKGRHFNDFVLRFGKPVDCLKVESLSSCEWKTDPGNNRYEYVRMTFDNNGIFLGPHEVRVQH